MNAKKTVSAVFLMALLMLLAACTLPGGTSPTDIPPTADPNQTVSSDTPVAPTEAPTEIPGEVITGDAMVDSIEVMIMESFPVQVSAVVTGNLPDGCTALDQAYAVRDENTFTLELTTVRPKDAACTDALVPFQETITLDVLGLSAGKYTVQAGAISNSFELAVDNIAPGGEDGVEPNDAALSGLVWHDLCANAEADPDTTPEGCVQLEDGSFQANGALDAGEPGLVDVQVTLSEDACPGAAPSTIGAVLATTTTSADGRFVFPNLAAGTYCITADSTSEAIDTSLSPGNWTFPEDGLGSMTVQLAASENREDVNFGWAAHPPAECANSAKFVEDVTVEDDSEMPAGQPFVKTWRLENTGTCTWTEEYNLVFSEGDQMGGSSPTAFPEGDVLPNEQVDLSVTFTAPDIAGTYEGRWLLADPDENTFGLGDDADEDFYLRIVVGESAGEDELAALGAPDWRDNFSTDDYWYLLDDDNYEFKIEEGHMLMRAKQVAANEEWGLSSSGDLTDFYLEATFTTGGTCSGLDRYGFLFRAPEPSEGYVLGVSCNGRYRLYAWDGEYNALEEWTSSGHIMTGPNQTNKIGVMVRGNEIRIFINRMLVAEFTDVTFDEGRFGLLIGAPESENLKIFVEEIAYWDLSE